MARRRDDDGFLEDLLKLLMAAPVWVGPCLAIFAFAALRWLVPWCFGRPDPNNAVAVAAHPLLAQIAAHCAPLAGGMVIFVWIFAELFKWKNRRRLDRQTGTGSIRALSWRDFERLLAEAFRRQGYAVEHVGGSGPDGGVDLRLRQNSERVLVQCKQWQKWKVDVKTVRELAGVVASERATRGIVVTSGSFTADAAEFARNVPITLIDGDELARMIADVQPSPAVPQLVVPIKPPQAVPTCPKCGSTMVVKTARKGANAGSQFWSCPRYPACDGKRQLARA